MPRQSRLSTADCDPPSPRFCVSWRKTSALDSKESIRDNASLHASLVRAFFGLKRSCLITLIVGFSIALAATGCTDDSNMAPDAGSPDLRPMPAPPVRKLSLPLDLDPNGLFWDAVS
jgi:hypothetical protein